MITGQCDAARQAMQLPVQPGRHAWCAGGDAAAASSRSAQPNSMAEQVDSKVCLGGAASVGSAFVKAAGP